VKIFLLLSLPVVDSDTSDRRFCLLFLVLRVDLSVDGRLASIVGLSSDGNTSPMTAPVRASFVADIGFAFRRLSSLSK
jgi:hypothetical protein